MPAATDESGEEDNIRDAEWLKLLSHKVVQSGSQKIIQSFRKGSIAPGQMLGVSL